VSIDWLKQEHTPLFANIFWQAPQAKTQAKKLLIIGGHSKQFSQTVEIYQAAVAAGIGEAKVVLPLSLKPIVGNQPDVLFANTTKSGSLGKAALAELKSYSSEVDGIIFSPEISYNAETITLIESLLQELSLPIFFGNLLIDMFAHNAKVLVEREGVVFSATKAFLKLASNLKINIKIAPQTSLLNKLGLLKEFSNSYPIDTMMVEDPLMVASGGKLSATPARYLGEESTALSMGVGATFWLQHNQHFEALTSAALVIARSLKLPGQGSAITLASLKQTIREFTVE